MLPLCLKLTKTQSLSLQNALQKAEQADDFPQVKRIASILLISLEMSVDKIISLL